MGVGATLGLSLLLVADLLSAVGAEVAELLLRAAADTNGGNSGRSKRRVGRSLAVRGRPGGGMATRSTVGWGSALSPSPSSVGALVLPSGGCWRRCCCCSFSFDLL